MKSSHPNFEENLRVNQQIAANQEKSNYLSNDKVNSDNYRKGNMENLSEKNIQDIHNSNFTNYDLEMFESYLLRRKNEIKQKMRALDQSEGSQNLGEQDQTLSYQLSQNQGSSVFVQNYLSPQHVYPQNKPNLGSQRVSDDKYSNVLHSVSGSQLISSNSVLQQSPEISFKNNKLQQSPEHQESRLQKPRETDIKKKNKEVFEIQQHERLRQKELSNQISIKQKDTQNEKNSHVEQHQKSSQEIHDQHNQLAGNKVYEHLGYHQNLDKKDISVVSATPHSYHFQDQRELILKLSEGAPIIKQPNLITPNIEEDEEIARKRREKKQKQQIADELRRQIQEKEEKKKLEKKRIQEEERREIEKFEREQREIRERNQKRNEQKNKRKVEMSNLDVQTHVESSGQKSTPSNHSRLQQNYQSPLVLGDLNTSEIKSNASLVLESRSPNQSSQQQRSHSQMQPQHPFFHPPSNWNQVQDGNQAQMLPSAYWPYMHPLYYQTFLNYANVYATPTQQDLNQFKELLKDIQEKSKREEQNSKERAMFKNKLAQNQKHTDRSRSQTDNSEQISHSNNTFVDSILAAQHQNPDSQKNKDVLYRPNNEPANESYYKNQSQNMSVENLQNSYLVGSEQEIKHNSAILQNEISLKKSRNRNASNQNSQFSRIVNENDISMKSINAESNISNQSHFQVERSLSRDLEAFKDLHKHLNSKNVGISGLEQDDPSISLSESEGVHASHVTNFRRFNQFEFAPVMEVGLEETPTQTTNFNQIVDNMRAANKILPDQIKTLIPEQPNEGNLDDSKLTNNNIAKKDSKSKIYENLRSDAYPQKNESLSNNSTLDYKPPEIQAEVDIREKNQKSLGVGTNQQTNQSITLKNRNHQHFEDYNNGTWDESAKMHESQNFEMTQSEVSRIELLNKEPIEAVLDMENSRYQKEFNLTDLKSERSIVVAVDAEALQIMELKMVENHSDRSLIIADDDEEENDGMYDKNEIKESVLIQSNLNHENINKSQLALGYEQHNDVEFLKSSKTKEGQEIQTHTQNIESNNESLQHSITKKNLEAVLPNFEQNKIKTTELEDRHSLRKIENSDERLVQEVNNTSPTTYNAEIEAKYFEVKLTKEIIAESALNPIKIDPIEKKSEFLISSTKSKEGEMITGFSSRKGNEKEEEQVQNSSKLKIEVEEVKVVDLKISTEFKIRVTSEPCQDQEPSKNLDNQNDLYSQHLNSSNIAEKHLTSSHLSSQNTSKSFSGVMGVSEKAVLLIKNSHPSAINKENSHQSSQVDSSAVSRLGLFRRIHIQKNQTHLVLPPQIDNTNITENLETSDPANKISKSACALAIVPLEEEQKGVEVELQYGPLKSPKEDQVQNPSLIKPLQLPENGSALDNRQKDKMNFDELSDTVEYPDEFSCDGNENFNDFKQVLSAQKDLIERQTLSDKKGFPSTSKQETLAEKELQAQFNQTQLLDNSLKLNQSYSSSNFGSERGQQNKIRTIDPYAKPSLKQGLAIDSNLSPILHSQSKENVPTLNLQNHPHNFKNSENQSHHFNKQRSQMILDRLMSLLGNDGRDLVFDTEPADLTATEGEDMNLEQLND